MGFVPFNLSIGRQVTARPNSKSSLYALAVALVCNGLFGWLMLFAHNLLNDKHETLLLVIIVDCLADLVRNIVVHFFWFWRRSEFIRLINEAQLIKNALQAAVQFKQFLDDHCRWIIQIKLMFTSVQLSIDVFSIILVTSHYETFDIMRISKYIFVIISADLVSIVLSAMHFVALLCMCQLYRHVNSHLAECVKKIRDTSQKNRKGIRMQMCCDISDRIDQLAALHKSVSRSTDGFRKVFSVSFLMILLNAFVFTLSSVKINLQL